MKVTIRGDSCLASPVHVPAPMKVTIITMSGETVHFEMTEATTLDCLRRDIHEHMSVPGHQQQLLSSTTELQGGHKTLLELGVQPDSVLTLVRSNRSLDESAQSIFVRVNNPPSHPKGSLLYTVDIQLQATVNDLLEKLFKTYSLGKELNLSTQQITEQKLLVFHDHPLENDCRLDDSFIEAYSTIELLLPNEHTDSTKDALTSMVIDAAYSTLELLLPDAHRKQEAPAAQNNDKDEIEPLASPSKGSTREFTTVAASNTCFLS